MFVSNEVEVDSWVQVDGRGQLSYELVGDEAQLRFGSARSSGLTLVLAERALAELATTAGVAMRLLRGESAAISDPGVDPPVSWARGVVDRTRAHPRQFRDGASIAHDVEGHRVGFAVCGAWLVDDCADPADANELVACSVCMDMLNRREFVDWER